MARVNPEKPWLSKLLKELQHLTRKCQVAYKGFWDCLEKILASLQRVNPYSCSNREIGIKISGDGTTVSCSVYLVVIPFVIHNETFASSSNDHYTIVSVNWEESYEYIAECNTDLLTEMESLKSLQVSDYTHNFTYFLGADMKFLAMVLGIEAANSTYSCIWYKCPARYHYNISYW